MSSRLLYARGGNEALDVNPNTGTDIHVADSGSDWYWTVFCIMAVTSLGYIGLAYKVPRRNRFFHYLSIGASFFACIQYFTMASNLGWAGVQTEFSHLQGGGIRQVFYARYIGWFMVAPLLILNMCFLAGLNWITALFTAAMIGVYIIGGLVGVVVSSTYKWGFFTIGLAAWFLVAYQLIWVCLRSLNELQSVAVEPKIRKYYRMLIGGVVFIYSLYPIAWGLSEGGNVITPTSEGVFYGVLDIISLTILNSFCLCISQLVDIEELGLGIVGEPIAPAAAAAPSTEKQN
ncbi:uncharacterized protein V1516DRAFT_668828 [Lipomyces oligophaga]|uniref:uncharacterized protein n=1 Tax=Lipomyces oligophaga TaxID=45792 RepID=UPI0034D01092